jgi:uncharacterized protein YggE
MRRLALLGVALVVLLAGAGGAVGSSTAVGGNSIVVTGQGSVRTVPDRAQVSLGVTTDANTASGALRANNAAIAKVIAAVKAQGIPATDIQTEQVSLSLRYDPNGTAVVGYTASNSISVIVRTLSKVGPVIDAGVEAGANQVSGPNLVLSDANALYRQAIRVAIGNARAKAQAIAKASGLSLRRITNVTESGGPTPLPIEAAKDSLPATGPPIEPGSTLVQATLTVTFSAA